MANNTFASHANEIFDRAVAEYHITDNIDAPYDNPYRKGSIEALLYDKNRIDAAQWHMEDIIRDPDIDPVDALKLKRRIDDSNQQRTDMVERIDDHFLKFFENVSLHADATINTESPAWAIDRLSILALKLWHMTEESERSDATIAHRQRCRAKLDVLRQQRLDLTEAIDTLLDDMQAGKKYMKVYRQMKMYNDTDTNPVLYNRK